MGSRSDDDCKHLVNVRVQEAAPRAAFLVRHDRGARRQQADDADVCSSSSP
jgi:hypothetical protein